MTNVLSFGNIVKQYPIRYLQELDTFQVQLSNHINIFGHKQVDNLYVLEGSQPREGSQQTPSSQENVPMYELHYMSKLLKRTPSFSLPRR